MNMAPSLESTSKLSVCYAAFYACGFLAYKLCEKHKRKRIISLGDHLVQLPHDIITEILSYLSVEDFLAYTSVWKPWKAVAEDHKFTKKFMMGKPKSYVFTQFLTKSDKRKVQKYSRTLAICDGLLLKMKHSWSKFEHHWMDSNYAWQSSIYVKNPVTHETLHLPEPHAERLGIGYSFAFVPSTCLYKLVSVYSEGNVEKCAVLTLGGDEHEWRYLDIPNPHNLISAKSDTRVVHADGAVHCIRDVNDESRIAYEIRSFDLESECFTVTHVYKDLIAIEKKQWPLNWNDTLSFVYLDGAELNVFAREDYQSNTWSKKFIIYVSFVETGMVIQELVPLTAQHGLLWFLSDDHRKIYHYDLENLRIAEDTVLQGRRKYECGPFCYVPSVVALKGMQRKQKGIINVVLLSCFLNYLALLCSQFTTA